MTDLRQRMRRTLPVVILDATLAIFVALQSGRSPWRRRPSEPDDDAPPAGAPVRRRTTAWAVAGGAAAVAGTAALLAVFLNSPDGLAPLGVDSPPPAAVERPPTGTASASPTAAPGVDGAVATTAPPDGAAPARPRPGPTPTAGPPAAPRPVPLAARYATSPAEQGLLGYRAAVTIANPGAVRTDGWVLTVTLPRPTLNVTDVSGATARQDGSTWTFTPDPRTALVPPGGSVEVRFVVRGAALIPAQPTACAVDNRPCAGL